LQQDTFDGVDAIIQQWRVERPELDPAAKHITGRIVRLAAHFQQAFADAYAGIGLNEGDFGVLAPLRRAGEPYELTPTELARHRMITSGGMTAAIDRVERKGMITRVPNPTDRRGSLVRLTDKGKEMIDAAMEAHAATEHRLVASLSEADAADLQRLLRQLLLATESA
jgi:DNA-binding MarR family transcriptional regulator